MGRRQLWVSNGKWKMANGKWAEQIRIRISNSSRTSQWRFTADEVGAPLASLALGVTACRTDRTDRGLRLPPPLKFRRDKEGFRLHCVSAFANSYGATSRRDEGMLEWRNTMLKLCKEAGF